MVELRFYKNVKEIDTKIKPTIFKNMANCTAIDFQTKKVFD